MVKKTKKINKTKKLINNLITIQKSIPPKYKSLYNKIKMYICRFKPLDKNIKLKISNLDNEECNDPFFPYKFYIELNCNEVHIKFEIYISDIVCNYTILL
jgi:hypothetical protein